MEKLYQDYKDLAAIYILYISEAHALDDARPVGYAEKLGIKEHTTFGERCAVASRLVKDKKLTIPCLVDNMDNAAAQAYQAWPDRIYVIRTDGTLAVAGDRGPWGFAPALQTAEKWLADFKETGTEPPPVPVHDERADSRRLQRELFAAYQSGDHAKALKAAEALRAANPDDAELLYNIACLHCLLGDHDKAFSTLEKAIEAGYADADHLLGDDDFKAIRKTERFAALVARVRERSQGAVDDGGGDGDAAAKPESQYRGRLGPKSKKIRTEGSKTWLWAGGDTTGAGAQWYDFTGATIPAEKLQFGIGKDRIPAIDDPLFVKPDDPRLLGLSPSPYRSDERPKTNDEIMVIGYVYGEEARAYPTALLDRHELVNDRVGGKPVTVGW